VPNQVYPKLKIGFLQGQPVNLLTGDVKVVLVDLADYAYNDAHQFLSDIPAAARVAISPVLANKTLSDLADFDSDDPILPAVTGDQLEAIVMFVDTGNEATSPLIYFQDTGIAGAPYTPDGNDLKIVVNAAGWFRL
jgi:hypothetical protein